MPTEDDKYDVLEKIGMFGVEMRAWGGCIGIGLMG